MSEPVDFASMTDEDLERYALNLLDRELGRAVFERFLGSPYAGSSACTRDRHKWLGHLTLDDIMRNISSAAKDRAA